MSQRVVIMLQTAGVSHPKIVPFIKIIQRFNAEHEIDLQQFICYNLHTNKLPQLPICNMLPQSTIGDSGVGGSGSSVHESYQPYQKNARNPLKAFMTHPLP